MSSKEFYDLLGAWLVLALSGGILAGGGWLLFIKPPRRLFGLQRFRAVPWTGADILVIVFLTYLFIPLVIQGNAQRHDPWLLRVDVIAFPFRVATIVLLFSVSSGTRLYQLGLTTHRLAANLVLGYLAWLILIPPVYGVDFLVSGIHDWLHHAPPEEHPFLEILHRHPGLLDWVMVVLATVVAAPCYEELLFRGVLQPWLARRRWGADAALVAALGVALLFGSDKIAKAFPLGGDPERFWTAVDGLAPAGFVLAMIPGYIFADWLLWSWLPQPGAGRTVYAVALLFAAGHANVWPTPIPLFFLGLGLGYLAYRTQSLVSSITVHVLFNGMTILSFLPG